MIAGELSVEQRLTLLEARMNNVEAALLAGSVPGARPPRLVASSPVDPTAFGRWGVTDDRAWWDATPYATKYGDKGHYHTGADLNLAAFADSGKPVYAAADGIVRFAGVVSGWQQALVVVEHNDAGELCWTRYAHISVDANVRVGQSVARGQVLGVIADYLPAGPAGDHLHFDVAKIDLGTKPDDWPGIDLARLKRDYVDPMQWLRGHQP